MSVSRLGHGAVPPRVAGRGESARLSRVHTTLRGDARRSGAHGHVALQALPIAKAFAVAERSSRTWNACQAAGCVTVVILPRCVESYRRDADDRALHRGRART